MVLRASKESSPKSGRKTSSGKKVDGHTHGSGLMQSPYIPSATTKNPWDDAKSKSLGTTQSPIPWDDAKSNPEREGRRRVQSLGTTQSPIPGLSDAESNSLKKSVGRSSPESWKLGDRTGRSGLCVYLVPNICSLSSILNLIHNSHSVTTWTLRRFTYSYLIITLFPLVSPLILLLALPFCASHAIAYASDRLSTSGSPLWQSDLPI